MVYNRGMNIFISGISGTGMGPLALMAKDAGHQVFGTDLAEGAVAQELREHGIDFRIGEQDGTFLCEVHERYSIDWFVYTSALPADHKELELTKSYGIRISKRDQLIAFLTEQLRLKMVAVAGTHGKTTTTSLLIYGAKRLGLPASYLVGTTLPFAASGRYVAGDEFFIYEADEYDRNFLHFHPWLSIITAVSYDHPDIYPTKADYQAAFAQFEAQCGQVIHGGKIDTRLTLAGELRREDATSAFLALEMMAKAVGQEVTDELVVEVLNEFPGAGRRFERICPGVYSDYAHHPEEITATVKMAIEEAKQQHLKGVVAVYQPHQNTRQHQVRDGYKKAFLGVDKLFWLPTYLTREDESLPVISPAEFIADLELSGKAPDGGEVAVVAEQSEKLAERLRALQGQGYLILLMTAGPADGWLRQVFA